MITIELLLSFDGESLLIFSFRCQNFTSQMTFFFYLSVDINVINSILIDNFISVLQLKILLYLLFIFNILTWRFEFKMLFDKSCRILPHISLSKNLTFNLMRVRMPFEYQLILFEDLFSEIIGEKLWQNWPN